MAGIYVHIPYCRKACHYCDFHFSTTLRSMPDMVGALVSEIERRGAQPQWRETTFSTVYFGGGTPSVMPTEQLKTVISALRSRFNILPNAEFTLEANPDDLTPEKLDALLQLGVNRLSVGIQSFHATDLSWMNRAHGADEALAVIPNIRRAGFLNFTIDLIYGLPIWTGDEWEQNLQIALDFEVPHLSCYILTVEPGTALGHQVKKKQITLLDEAIPTQYNLLCERTKQAGYEHYEVSNFARKGARSQHNGSYWKGLPYVGIGPGAHGFSGNTRYANIASNTGYIRAAGDAETHEELTLNDRYNELIMTRLRTSEGLNIDECLAQFGRTPADVDAATYQRYLQEGVLAQENGCVRVAEKAWLMGDRIASDFFWV